MAQSLVLTGANIRLYINNKLYKTVQSITFTVSYNTTQVYGIDSPYAQELTPTKVEVTGSCTGIRLRNSGGLQAQNMRPLYSDFSSGGYISLRINDRASGEDIIFLPQTMITRETHVAATKGSYKLNFDFVSSLPLFALDRS
jgi:hypothetical protein